MKDLLTGILFNRYRSLRIVILGEKLVRGSFRTDFKRLKDNKVYVRTNMALDFYNNDKNAYKQCNLFKCKTTSRYFKNF